MVEKNFLSGLNNYLMFRFLGGPEILKTRYVVNLFKGSTWIYCIFLMHLFKNYSIEAYVYTALHGSYGFLWILKDFVFPDSNWEKKQTIASLIIGIILLGPGYWGIPYLLISKQSLPITNFRIMLAIMTYAIGVSIMLVSDAQKYFTLKYKKGLINVGMFKYTRNPNYLGEVMVYGGFGMLVRHQWTYLVLGIAWLVLFNLNMYLKDHDSLKYKNGWQQYQQTSNRLLPRCFLYWVYDNIFYVLIFQAFYQISKW